MLLVKDREKPVNINMYHQAHSKLPSPDKSFLAKHSLNKRASLNFEFPCYFLKNKIGIIKKGITKTQLEAIKSETDFEYNTLGKFYYYRFPVLLLLKRKVLRNSIEQPVNALYNWLFEIIVMVARCLKAKISSTPGCGSQTVAWVAIALELL